MSASQFQLAHWRNQIFEIYHQVRKLSDASPAQAWQLWHTRRSRLYHEHPMSPVPQSQSRAFNEIDVFNYNPSMRFLTDIKPQLGGVIHYDLGHDGTLVVQPFAETIGLASTLGTELTLYRLAGYGGGIFLPFKDTSSGTATYGGGRYLLDTIKGADLGTNSRGKLIVDFNFAYMPSCAWSKQFVCPLAPTTNTLPSFIKAGEKIPSFEAT